MCASMCARSHGVCVFARVYVCKCVCACMQSVRRMLLWVHKCAHLCVSVCECVRVFMRVQQSALIASAIYQFLCVFSLVSCHPSFP